MFKFGSGPPAMAKARSVIRAQKREQDGASTEERSYTLAPEVWKRLDDEAERLGLPQAVFLDAAITHWFLAGMKPNFVVVLESSTGHQCWKGSPKEADALGSGFTCPECGEIFVKAKDRAEFLIVGSE